MASSTSLQQISPKRQYYETTGDIEDVTEELNVYLENECEDYLRFGRMIYTPGMSNCKDKNRGYYTPSRSRSRSSSRSPSATPQRLLMYENNSGNPQSIVKGIKSNSIGLEYGESPCGLTPMTRQQPRLVGNSIDKNNFNFNNNDEHLRIYRPNTAPTDMILPQQHGSNVPSSPYDPYLSYAQNGENNYNYNSKYYKNTYSSDTHSSTGRWQNERERCEIKRPSYGSNTDDLVDKSCIISNNKYPSANSAGGNPGKNNLDNIKYYAEEKNRYLNYMDNALKRQNSDGRKFTTGNDVSDYNYYIVKERILPNQPNFHYNAPRSHRWGFNVENGVTSCSKPNSAHASSSAVDYPVNYNNKYYDRVKEELDEYLQKESHDYINFGRMVYTPGMSRTESSMKIVNSRSSAPYLNKIVQM